MENYSVYNAIFDTIRVISLVIIIYIVLSNDLLLIEYIGLIGGGLLILKDVLVSIVKDMANE